MIIICSYIIPTPVVKHFISGVEENGKFPGFCSLGISCQHMQNTRMRNYFKMTPKMTGILIKRINPLSSSYGILKKDDILLSIDGVSIGNDETGNIYILHNFFFNIDSGVKVHHLYVWYSCFSEDRKHKFQSLGFYEETTWNNNSESPKRWKNTWIQYQYNPSKSMNVHVF